MKTKLVSAIIIVFASSTMMQSCKKDSKDENNGETNISATGGHESHNMSQNCMNCHKKGGEGKGWFSVAGTVYDSLLTNTFQNVIVRLYTGPDGTGTLKSTIYGDAKGNFFTTEAIDFGVGLYPSVQGISTTQFMSGIITNGQCNSCHGVTTDKIWTK